MIFISVNDIYFPSFQLSELSDGCRDNLLFIGGMYDGLAGRSVTADSRDHCVINAGILRPPEPPGFLGYFTIIVKSRPASYMAVTGLLAVFSQSLS